MRELHADASVTVDDSGAVILTTVLGQTCRRTPYDYGVHLDPVAGTGEAGRSGEPPPF